VRGGAFVFTGQQLPPNGALFAHHHHNVIASREVKL
jgi:hypothetical protein